jgi:hypothetical protein
VTAEAFDACKVVLTQLSTTDLTIAFKRARLLAGVRTHLVLDPLFLLDEHAPTYVESTRGMIKHIFASKQRGVAANTNYDATFVNQLTSRH